MRIFSYVYQFQSVRETARTLNITPSAISQSLKLLEKETGHRLFQRLSKRMVPTSMADSLFVITKGFIKDIEGCLRSNNQNNPYGHLKIGAPPELGSREIVGVISEFESFEGATFSIHFDLPDRLMALLVDGKIDLAFCDAGSYLKNYGQVATWESVFKEEAVLVCSKSFYSKYVNGNHSFSHLSGLSHVDYRQDAGVLSLWYRHHFGRVPKQIRLKLVANNVNAMITAAKNGMGLAFIPTRLIEKESKHLVTISIKKTAYVNPIMLVQMKDKVPSLLEKKFISICAERFQNQSSS